MTRGRCPAPAEVERLYWSTRDRAPAERDLELREHITACVACAAQWADIAALVALGTKLEPPAAWERREEIRTTLLSSSRVPSADRSARPVRAWRWAVPALALAVAAVVVAWQWPSRRTVPGTSRAMVLDHGTARRLVVSPPPDEIVRLVDGSVTITVAALAAGERFRLITGDGEVEAADAAFDIAARDDRLVAVRAIHGAVRVLIAGERSTLRAGETWRATTELANAPPDAETAPDAATPPVGAIPAPVSPLRHVDPPLARPPPRIEPPSSEAAPEPVPREARAVAPGEPAADASPAPVPRSMGQQAFDDGWTALRASDFAGAATAFERAIAITSDPRLIEDATFWCGVSRAREGKVVVAAHVFTAFLSAYPSSARAREVSVMLGWLLYERGDVAEARRRFEVGLTNASRDVRDSATAGLRAIANRH